MSKCLAIQNPEILHINDRMIQHYGANQVWYPKRWQRQAGCGATTCSHLLWYLSKTRAGCKELCPYEGERREGYLGLMEEVFCFVKPGPMGVNRAEIFTAGAIAYGAIHKVRLEAQILKIPAFFVRRPDYPKVESFISDALEQNYPLGFLNLSNGTLVQLESWHWVTLVGIEKERILMYDQGRRVLIDLKRWLQTTIFGGALVVLREAAAHGAE